MKEERHNGQTVVGAESADIRAWLVQMISRGLSPRTLNRKISSLKSFYRFCQKRGSLRKNPMNAILSPRVGRRLPEFVREDELRLLLDELPFADDFYGLRDRTVLELLYGTGMRRAELIGLKDADIDWSNHHLRILGKGRKERLSPVFPALEELLKLYQAEREATFPGSAGGYLILSNRGNPAYARLIHNIVEQYLSGITTLSRRSPHILRHSFATHLSNQGAPLNAIKELLGHASLAATQVYMHNSIDRLKEVYRQAHPKSGEDK